MMRGLATVALVCLLPVSSVAQPMTAGEREIRRALLACHAEHTAERERAESVVVERDAALQRIRELDSAAKRARRLCDAAIEGERIACEDRVAAWRDAVRATEPGWYESPWLWLGVGLVAGGAGGVWIGVRATR